MNLNRPAPSRRRFIAIAAGISTMAIAPARAAPSRSIVWSGSAMGADASITIHHPDPVHAEQLLARCRNEISRLENQLSLFQPDSAVSRLNRAGVLHNPPDDFLNVLRIAREINQSTDGLFDITVQPLWQLYAGHFSAPDADPAGPSTDAIAAARARTGAQHLYIEDRAVHFRRPGMAVTLNGIAQGYITGQIAHLLRHAGMEQVLLDLGETCAIGPHPDGRAWKIGLRDPLAPWRNLQTLALRQGALATSGGYGAPFDASGNFHHLFDPATGRCASQYRSLSITGPDAARADALSTGLSAMPLHRAKDVLTALGRNWGGLFITRDGHAHRHNWSLS